MIGTIPSQIQNTDTMLFDDIFYILPRRNVEVGSFIETYGNRILMAQCEIIKESCQWMKWKKNALADLVYNYH